MLLHTICLLYTSKNGVDSKVKYNQVANYIYLDTQVNKAISDNAVSYTHLDVYKRQGLHTCN